MINPSIARGSKKPRGNIAKLATESIEHCTPRELRARRSSLLAEREAEVARTHA